jgi:gliding motility-associated-like protein
MVVYNAHDCSDTTSKVIYVNNNTIWIPNSFTPLSETNNRFDIVAAGVQDFEIDIYNREGMLVFHSNDVNNSWDGTHNGKYCPQGAYVYIIRYSFRNQKSETLIRKGNVLIIY